MATDDADLLHAWSAGDKASCAELVKRHGRRIRRFFANKMDGGDVDDLVQRTFLACLEALPRFRRDAPFEVFLLRVAINVFREEVRTRIRQRNRVESLETSVHDLGTTIGTVLVRNNEQKLLLKALRHLPYEQQLVLELHYWEQMSGPEIAALLEITESAVRGRLRLAREKLRSKLEELAESPKLLESTASDLDGWARALNREPPP